MDFPFQLLAIEMSTMVMFFSVMASYIICRNSKRKQHFLTAYHHAFIDNQGITLTLEKGTRFLIDTKPQLLCPVANCRISRYFTENIAHKLIQDIEYFNNLT